MVGFRVLKRRRKVDGDIIEKFRALPVANISDVMGRMTAGGASLRPRHGGGNMAGPAVTVKTRPGDNLMIHKALDIAEPGDIVVVDGGGDNTNSLVGELMIAHAKTRRLGGLVLNGAIRDSAWIRENDFPVFATGISHRGPYKDGPGEINVPIAIAGMVIEPGDLVVGDEDGLLGIPFADVDRVYAAAKAKSEAEAVQMHAILEGRSNRTWIDEALKKKGCEIEI